ncbi:DUF4082 domain-containing protein [Streptomyces sp. NPDC090025]|uniref:DUF4082 domain-containing protein n=1 Tax=Streptomyces sp. NPDC090025 TaxID=3365922 RepID=UPI0038378A70
MQNRLRRARGAIVALAAALTAIFLPSSGQASAVADPCGSGSNPIVCENSKPGTPMSEWFSGNNYGDIAGFSTKMSVQPGETVQFKIQSPVAYHVRIFRLGWYGGDGARQMSTDAQADQSYPATYLFKRPDCLTEKATGLLDCGNWPTTASWQVPSNAPSGLYIANFDQGDGNGLMPYPFVVRNDASTSDILVQTSDQTWQAYNDWGGTNLYDGNGPAPDGRAYKVSYNRPLDISGDNGVYGSEFEMIAWLERNGYDVSYASGIDVATRGATILPRHKMYMSQGHDEYWTAEQFTHVLNARKAGQHQTYFSGNEVFWKTRLEPGIDASHTADRTLVCYKETKLKFPTPNGVPDPSTQWTGTWMDPDSTKGGAPYRPQNILTGSLFQVNGYRSDAITVPAAFAKMRLWRDTSVANLTGNQVATFPQGTLGYEWDADVENASRPAGQIRMSSTAVDVNDGKYLLDWGNNYGNGTATHSLVAFRDPTSRALVFGAGTVQWSWGLTNVPTADPDGGVVTEDKRMQQATVNILADMGIQPLTRQDNLVRADASNDTTGPTVTVTSPAPNSAVPALQQITVTGTANDPGTNHGVVARVEVSTDGGTTWRAAEGTTSWSYTWTPMTMGPAQLKVRAVDDSVNIGATTTVPLTVEAQRCPCTVWPASAAPALANGGDGSAVELGVKVRSSVPGTITGVRFYKSAVNTGTHKGSLWSASGQLLATGTFTGETASGWQTLKFANPVPVKADTTYVASYYAPNGGYAYDAGYFADKGAGLAPLTALKNGVDGGNGVYKYASASAFPSQSSGSSNYWVDAILETGSASTAPPTVTGRTPAVNATGVAINSPLSATFSEALDASTLVFTVKEDGGATVPGTATLSSDGRTAAFTLAGQLALGTTYTASVQAADLWGNAMGTPVSWDFTTSDTPPPASCPCRLWGPEAVPAKASETSDSNALELGTRFTSALDGKVTGVTFYKGAGNTGTHTGSLWSDSGTLLATGTFTGETAAGWQTLTFAAPVPVTANTRYVVSYHAPGGNYASDAGYFATPHLAYPLSAPADGPGSANGLYRYGASAFPNNSYNGTNYWVGPVFTTG